MEARHSRTEIVICGMVVIGVAGFISDQLVLPLGQTAPVSANNDVVTPDLNAIRR
jgi:hypothetical protein